MMKAILYYPMLFVRPFLKMALRLLGGVTILGSIVVMFAIGFSEALPMFGIAFVLFMIGMAYDAILLKLVPEGQVLILDQ